MMPTPVKIISLVLVLALVEGSGAQKVCYPTEETRCFGPDYYDHWTGIRCVYGDRGGLGNCFIWLRWWMIWLYASVLLPVVLAIIGGICFALCRSDPAAGVGVGIGAGCSIACPCICIPLILYIFLKKIKCELCGVSLKPRGKEALKHRKSCLEKNRSTYNNIPHSSLYSCKKCETNLKLWPMEKLSKSSCIKCSHIDDCDNHEIVNNGSNLHVCFTCASTGTWSQHHLCSRHTRGETITEVDWENLKNLPSADVWQTQPRPGSQQNPSQSRDALPPGWKLLTNPVTGIPYGLCDPSGEIKPLADSSTAPNDGNPPPYAEAGAYPSAEPLLVMTTCNEKLNIEAGNLRNKSQGLMRQSSIEMTAAARRFRKMGSSSKSGDQGIPEQQSMLPYPLRPSESEAQFYTNPNASPNPV